MDMKIKYCSFLCDKFYVNFNYSLFNGSCSIAFESKRLFPTSIALALYSVLGRLGADVCYKKCEILRI